jgi:hypothetical protein
MNVLLLQTPRCHQGSLGVALSWLAIVSSKVLREPVVEARVAQPYSLWSSKWSRPMGVYWWVHSYLLRCRVARLLLLLWSIVDISYAASQAHRIINVAVHREYSPGIIFIFSHGRKDLYHV